jgi:hypothetical protein
VQLRKPRLIALIGGRTAPVHPAFAGDPLSRLYCARCHGRYTGPWKLDRQDAGLPEL